MSSRSNPFSSPEVVVNTVPPTELDGGTFAEQMMYHLYVALWYAEQNHASTRITQPIRLALRMTLTLHQRGKYFDEHGRIRRSARR